MKSIKLVLLAIIAMCFCANVNAVELGDYMEIDGVPAIVIYVDATGEHGLVMSATAHDSKEDKAIKKYIDRSIIKMDKDFAKRGIDASNVNKNYLNLYLTLPPYSNKQYQKMKKQIVKHLENLAGATTAYGQENADIIANYCADNNLDMSLYFPDQAWAAELGNGWFIPGNAELEIFGTFMGAEYHKKQNLFEITKTVKDATASAAEAYVNNNNGVAECWSPAHYRGIFGCLTHNLSRYFYLPMYVKSSTLINSSWTSEEENAGKVTTEIANSIKKGKFVNAYYALGTQMAAFIGGNQWVAFYNSNDKIDSNVYKCKPYIPQIVAVKEF